MKREGFKKSKHWVVANGETPKEEGVHSLEVRFRLCVRSQIGRGKEGIACQVRGASHLCGYEIATNTSKVEEGL
jgi:hypothetical protein